MVKLRNPGRALACIQLQRQLYESPEEESAKRSTASKLSEVRNEAEGDKTARNAANRSAGLLSNAPSGRLLEMRSGS